MVTGRLPLGGDLRETREAVCHQPSERTKLEHVVQNPGLAQGCVRPSLAGPHTSCRSLSASSTSPVGVVGHPKGTRPQIPHSRGPAIFTERIYEECLGLRGSSKHVRYQSFAPNRLLLIPNFHKLFEGSRFGWASGAFKYLPVLFLHRSLAPIHGSLLQMPDNSLMYPGVLTRPGGG